MVARPDYFYSSFVGNFHYFCGRLRASALYLRLVLEMSGKVPLHIGKTRMRKSKWPFLFEERFQRPFRRIHK